MNFRNFSEKVRDISHFKLHGLHLTKVEERTLKNQLSLWEKQGKVHHLKKGLYTLNEQDRRAPLSRFLISNLLYAPSYVSLESALSFYGLIPERVPQTTAVSTRKTMTFENHYGLFNFQTLKKSAFFGFDTVSDEDGLPVFMALPEKAILDKIYLDPSSIPEPGYYLENLRLQHYEVFNQRRLLDFAKKFNSAKVLSMARVLCDLIRQERNETKR